MQIINYSEKAIAVIGDPETQKANKKRLKELGGSYNPRLKFGAGWVFSRKKLGAHGLRVLTNFVTSHGGKGLSEREKQFNDYILTNTNPATKIG